MARKSKPKASVRLDKAERPKCLTCSNLAQTRGLCFTCRGAASAAVLRGEATEVELIARGLMLPPKRKGRPAESGFWKAMHAAKSSPKKSGQQTKGGK